MKYTSLLGLGLAALFCLSVRPASAMTLSAGTLIKASGPAVYYYATNGKRLVFPTEKTFKTWYSDFSSVVTITDAELAALPLGGNVTYKPGARLVKITTDPKVYAVAAGGFLRHLASESVAAALYGADWATKVDDVPDAFFTNYLTSAAINTASDYSPSGVLASATNIDVDRTARTQVPTPCTTCQTTSTPPIITPAPTTTVAEITLTPSENPIFIGDTLTLSATASHPKGIRKISLSFDDKLITGCDFTTSCSGDYILPLNFDKTQYEAKVTVTTVDQQEFTKTLTLNAGTSTTGSSEAIISLDRAIVRPGESTGILVQAGPTIHVKEITIYVDGNAHKLCQSTIQCNWSEAFNGAVGTVFSTYGIITNDVGRTYRTATKTITLAENDSPQITFSSGLTPVNAGNQLMVTVTASDENGILWSKLLDDQRNLLKQCDGAVPCTLVTGPWTQKGTVTLYGLAHDLLGAEAEQPFVFQVN